MKQEQFYARIISLKKSLRGESYCTQSDDFWADLATSGATPHENSTGNICTNVHLKMAGTFKI